MTETYITTNISEDLYKRVQEHAELEDININSAFNEILKISIDAFKKDEWERSPENFKEEIAQQEVRKSRLQTEITEGFLESLAYDLTLKTIEQLLGKGYFDFINSIETVSLKKEKNE